MCDNKVFFFTCSYGNMPYMYEFDISKKQSLEISLMANLDFNDGWSEYMVGNTLITSVAGKEMCYEFHKVSAIVSRLGGRRIRETVYNKGTNNKYDKYADIYYSQPKNKYNTRPVIIFENTE